MNIIPDNTTLKTIEHYKIFFKYMIEHQCMRRYKAHDKVKKCLKQKKENGIQTMKYEAYSWSSVKQLLLRDIFL